jgi:hypothetical protein
MRCCTDGTQAPSEAFPQLQNQNHYRQGIYMEKTHSCNADTSERRKRIQIGNDAYGSQINSGELSESP